MIKTQTKYGSKVHVLKAEEWIHPILALFSSVLSTTPQSFVKLPINNQSTDQSYLLTYDHPKENRKSEGYSKSLGNYTFADYVW